MGMFDSMYVACSCGRAVEFQSKAGRCNLRRYSMATVPLEVATDLDGESERCPNCGSTLIIHARASVTIEEIRDGGNDESG